MKYNLNHLTLALVLVLLIILVDICMNEWLMMNGMTGSRVVPIWTFSIPFIIALIGFINQRSE
ncbi:MULTISPECIES: hypothetical protein [Bacillaceae]|uniref:Uncharacterized protein n=1 Tax=Evansella alkalicola TaxID=745819 RepID=A0ABS6JY27_9BACI|nr:MULTISPECIES: hypothetical protein [Bacillaceae]MBU9723503.1 hypothetical protein [Bacillus alkalicola]